MEPKRDLVLVHYLAGAISLGRAAEILEIPWHDLRRRLSRLGIAVLTGPVDDEDARQDALIAESFAS